MVVDLLKPIDKHIVCDKIELSTLVLAAGGVADMTLASTDAALSGMQSLLSAVQVTVQQTANTLNDSNDFHLKAKARIRL